MTHTIVGIFDSKEEARDAMNELVEKGFVKEDIDFSNRRAVADTDAVTTATNDADIGDSISNFFGNLFSDDETTANNYSTVARETEAILTIQADSRERAEKAAAILDNHGAVNVDERAAQYRQQYGETETNRTADGEVIEVVEENLNVGKRTVETGGVRVRSRVIEKPVEETLRLREEHVVVQRRPVNRAATEADFANATGDIEITERAEKAVVGKEARVVEEIAVGKTVEEHDETVTDTVRKTEVEVEELDTDVRRANN